ncbi:MAG: hypothetical protein M1819_001941 [Sarea resinae]|nr:MAG: hypothetical protein M1819_001941 [Sarea resinae]
MTSFSRDAPQSYRNHFVEPPTVTEQVLDHLPHGMRESLYELLGGSDTVSTAASRIPHQLRRAQWRWNPRRFVTAMNAFILIWAAVLWWGERSVFRDSIVKCEWASWERWPRGSTPHRTALIADPQLVDPHTYPGRPWPLSTFTIRHTDSYLRRSYTVLERVLHPDTLFFLGDLFDGGREWATYSSHSPEERYRNYGEDYWLREYNRFGKIFFKHWGDGGMVPNAGQQGRKIVAGLPGNHDLGLGVGIQLPVRNRFHAYFGDGNRIDVLGNHTFVSVDTVSLSAKGQADPATASQGSGLGDVPGANDMIWKPVEEFLNDAQSMKRRAMSREIRLQNGQLDHMLYEPVVMEVNSTDFKKPPSLDPGQGMPEFPTVLLTHVPLYRAPGTPCGPQREHWPPSPPPNGQTQPLEHDEPNAIAVRQGYQYQNVLTPEVSKQLVEKVGNVGYVFSGDDHDYCEVIHRGYTSSGGAGAGGIREITVKSISWAMGVRKPGFLLLSLWNPLDGAGLPIGTQGGGHGAAGGGAPTIETHLCLLPDQLAIFIRYGVLLVITVTVLVIRAALLVYCNWGASSTSSSITENETLLPTTTTARKPNPAASSAENEKVEDRYHSLRKSSPRMSSEGTHSSNSSASSYNGLSARTPTARTRSISPMNGYGIPVSSSQSRSGPNNDVVGNFAPRNGDIDELEPWNAMESVGAGGSNRSFRHHTPLQRLRAMAVEAKRSIWYVAWVVLLWYFWLCFTV